MVLQICGDLCSKYVSRGVCICAEIEMVVMEKCKVPELTEQNITDEEKTAAATRTHTQRSRYMRAHTNIRERSAM